MAPCSWTSSTLGIQVSVCGVEFSAFYGPTCPACIASEAAGNAAVTSAANLPEWLGASGTGTLGTRGPWDPVPLAEHSPPGLVFHDRGLC